MKNFFFKIRLTWTLLKLKSHDKNWQSEFLLSKTGLCKSSYKFRKNSKSNSAIASDQYSEAFFTKNGWIQVKQNTFYWKKVARLQQLLYQNLYYIPMFMYDFFFVYNLQKYEICAQRNALKKHFKIYYIFYKYGNLRIVFFIFPYEYPRQ